MTKALLSGDGKVCTRCLRARPLDDFHKALLGALGRAAICKACVSARAHERYKKKRRYIREQTRAYRERHAEQLREASKRRYQARKEQVRELVRANRRANPDKFRARQAVAKALKRGLLTKPDACEKCGRKDAPRLVAHHHSYAKEFWLDVEFICNRCHSRHHGEERAA